MSNQQEVSLSEAAQYGDEKVEEEEEPEVAKYAGMLRTTMNGSKMRVVF